MRARQLRAQRSPWGVVRGDVSGFEDGIDSGGSEVGKGKDTIDEHGGDVKGLRKRRETRHCGAEFGASHTDHDDVALLVRPPDT